MKILIIILIVLTTFCLQAKKGLVRIGDLWVYGWGGLQCIDSNTCYALDQCHSCSFEEGFFEISRTKDGGKTWNAYKQRNFKRFKMSGATQLKQSFFLDDKNYYFGYGVMITNDGGDNYNFQKLDYSHNANDIFYMQDTINGLVCNWLSIFVTNDGWKTNKEIKFENLSEFENVEKRTDSTVFMSATSIQKGVGLGYFSCLIEFNLFTHNYKMIYVFPSHPDDYNDTPVIERFDFKGDVGVYAISRRRPTSEVSTYYYDIIFNTKDGGKTWKRSLDTLITPAWSFTDIEMRDSLYGLAVGDLGKIYETIDGGDTWEFIYLDNWRDYGRARLEFAGQTAIIGSFAAGMFRFEELDDTLSIKTNQEATIWQSRDMLYTSPEYIGKTLFLYDLLGNLYLTAEIHSELNISHLTQGLYFYRIEESGVLLKSGSFLLSF